MTYRDEVLRVLNNWFSYSSVNEIRAAIAAIPEPSAEPVAWQVRWVDLGEGPSTWRECSAEDVGVYRRNSVNFEVRPLYAAPPSAEPVAVWTGEYDSEGHAVERPAPPSDLKAAKRSDCGHGHVWPRADGVRARCGGPGICAMCSIDAARKREGA